MELGRVPRARQPAGDRRHPLRDQMVQVRHRLGGRVRGLAARTERPAHAPFILAHCDGGYTTNLPVADVTGGRAGVAFGYGGKPLAPEHGGPARLLVPHLYFWKSAKWVRRLELLDSEVLGFWENYGYHRYGDPWREQRYAGD